MAFQRGDVVLVPFPFTDLSNTKVRPAVIVSSALYHAVRREIVVAALTTNISDAKGQLDYVLLDWRGAGLMKPSAFKPKLVSLHQRKVIHRVGTLRPADMAVVIQRLRLMLDL